MQIMTNYYSIGSILVTKNNNQIIYEENKTHRNK